MGKYSDTTSYLFDFVSSISSFNWAEICCINLQSGNQVSPVVALIWKGTKWAGLHCTCMLITVILTQGCVIFVSSNAKRVHLHVDANSSKLPSLFSFSFHQQCMKLCTHEKKVQLNTSTCFYKALSTLPSINTITSFFSYTVHYIKTKNHLGINLFQWKTVRFNFCYGCKGQKALFSKISALHFVITCRCRWKAIIKNPHFSMNENFNRAMYIDNVDRA